jgi:hypothetical protein
MIVVGNSQGIRRKKTEEEEEKEAPTGYEKEVAEDELALKILLDKKISSFVLLGHG